MADTLITPEVRALLGQETPPERNRFPISEEMVYDLADATEDPNPLYVDREHAQRSRFGGLLCPPLATWKDIAPPIGYFGAGQESHFQVPLPFNSYGLNGGSDWEFRRPAYVGDWVTRQFRILDIYEKQGRSGPLVFVVRQETQANQRGQVISLARRVSIHRALPAGDQPREAVNARQQLQTVSVAPPDPEVVLPRPSALHRQQRYFEEVAVGIELPPVVKGPITTTHLVRWAAANGNYARIHWDLPFAQLRQGLPNVVVNGSLKNQYLGQLLINFAGEEGWLRRFYVEHRGMDFPGDVLTASGAVTGKREEDGFGHLAVQVALGNSRGNFGYATRTRTEYSLTARTPDGTGSGWASAESYRLADVDAPRVAGVAIDKAVLSQKPRPIEPGKYTVVLEAAAVAEILQPLFNAFNARAADEGRSLMTKRGGGTRLGEKMFSEKISARTDPFDTRNPGLPWVGNVPTGIGGVGQFFFGGGGGGPSFLPSQKMTWIEKGVVKNLVYDRYWARKKDMAPTPSAGTGLVIEGEDHSLEELIAATERGLLVTRFWYIRSLNPQTVQLTGLTRDGLFRIEKGKVVHPVMNLRWNESPANMLANVEMLGRAERMDNRVVPAMKVKEFTFSSVSDAV